jgi:regulator of RNase E activity RraA
MDGCVRDVSSIRETGFPVFCKNFSPVKSLWDLETVQIGEPVVIESAQVRKGDIIFADETGIVVIPQNHLDHVVLQAKRIREEENEIIRGLID